ncbi:aminoglycoside phosphotransferase (APT) family kinase protein [Sphingobium subterraneum]|uniref:Aminoglycoside phosphotransferase (APT) family kinase protein n=1 Tax=Sphingobium subterraneum TaxID=627688 RepID=A0A841J4W3_9SPHN|nr:aminoglycoside phosphotransferase (APT) family kinase protein [Sphingobium subterraneum]
MAAWLRDNGVPTDAPLRIEKFPGGQSNPTYLVQAEHDKMVLRRKPFGPLLPSAHAVEREFKLISALYPTGIPVARPIALCEDPAVIGSAFYVMGYSDGRTFWNGSLPDVDPAERIPLYRSMVETLADLHSVDFEAAGLGDFRKPGNYFERQLNRWIKQYRAAQTDEIPEMESLIEWLPRTVPEQTGVSIIHGDFRIDNLIFDHTSPRVLALIDWELATIGDPLADLSYFAMNWLLPVSFSSGLLDVDLAAQALPKAEELTDIYCARTGRRGIPDLNWYFSYGLFRLACIIQGIKRRTIDGNASSDNPEAVIAQIPVLARTAWEQARLAGAPKQ